MGDCLTSCFSAVNDDSVSLIGKTKLLNNASEGAHKAAPQSQIRDGIDRSNMFLRHDKHVHRRLRIDIPKRQSALVLIDDIRRELS